MSQQRLLSLGGGSKRGDTWSPWQGFVLPWGGWDSPVLGLGTEMWPAGLPANTQGSVGSGLGHCALPLEGGKSRAVRRCPGRRDVIAGVGQGVLGLGWGLSCLCLQVLGVNSVLSPPSYMSSVSPRLDGWGLHPQIRGVPVMGLSLSFKGGLGL